MPETDPNSPVIIADSLPKVKDKPCPTPDIQLTSGEVVSGYESHFELMLGTLLSGCTNDALEGSVNPNRMQAFVDYWDARNPCPVWEDTPETRELIRRAKQHLVTKAPQLFGPDVKRNKEAYEQISNMIGWKSVLKETEDVIIQQLIRIKGLGSILRVSAEHAAQEMAIRLRPNAYEAVVYTREVGFVLDYNKLHMMQTLVKDAEVLKLIKAQGFSDIGTYAKAVADGKVQDTVMTVSPSDDELIQELVLNSPRRKKHFAYNRILRALDSEDKANEKSEGREKEQTEYRTKKQLSNYLRHPSRFWREYQTENATALNTSDESAMGTSVGEGSERQDIDAETLDRLTPQVKLSLLNALIPVYYPHVFKKESEIPDATMLVTARTDFIRFSAPSVRTDGEGTHVTPENKALKVLQSAVRHNLHGITLGELQHSDTLQLHAEQIRDAVELIAQGKILVQIGEIKLDIGPNKVEQYKVQHKYKEDVAHSVTAILQTLATLDRGLPDPIPLCLCARILLDDDPIRAIRRTVQLTLGGVADRKRVIQNLRGDETPQDHLSKNEFQENMFRLFSILERNVSVSLVHYQWNLTVEEGADGVTSIPLEAASTPPITDIFTYPPNQIRKSVRNLTSKLVKTWVDQQAEEQSTPLGARLRRGTSLGYAEIDQREIDQTPPDFEE